MSAFFCKKISVFCPKRYLYSSCVRDFLVLFYVFVRQKVIITENITFADSVSRIRSSNYSKLTKNPKNEYDVTHDVIVKFFWRCFVSLAKFSYWSKFHVNAITGSGIWQFSFIRDWPEIWKSEIPPSEFCPISGDWVELWIPDFARMSLIKCYWMLQNSRVTAFTVFELLREN